MMIFKLYEVCVQGCVRGYFEVNIGYFVISSTDVQRKTEKYPYREKRFKRGKRM